MAKQTLIISEAFKAKAEKDYNKLHNNYFYKEWFDTIQKECNLRQVKNDKELHECLKACRQKQIDIPYRDGGAYLQLLDLLLSYYQ